MSFRYCRTAVAGFVFAAVSGILTLDSEAQNTTNFPQIGKIERFDPAADALLPEDAVIEVLAGGYEWCEGPVWDKWTNSLLFSEIPSNTVMKWIEGKGAAPFLKPSGYTGFADYGGEPGSNGLLIDAEGRLISCEHGDRRISILTRDGGKRTLADNYKGKRFNSPNDICQKSDGSLYFTDPIYGLPKRWDDPRRELDFCGVYRLDGEGGVTLLTDIMTRPNGIAFSPDEKTLYVAQSDPKAAIWRSFPVKADGTLGEGKLFFDATEMVGKHKGLPDGLKVDVHGNLWATGPGGVHIFDPAGKPIARIDPGEAVSNVGWGGDGSDIYLTADMFLCRVRTTTKGDGWK